MKTNFFLSIILFTGLAFNATANPNINSHITISTQGYGPIKIGMTVKEASDASNSSIIEDAQQRETPNCYYAHFVDKKFTGISFMVEGNKIATIYIAKPASVKTAEGAHIGISVKSLRQIYGNKLQGNEDELFVFLSDRYGYRFYCEDCTDNSTVGQYDAGDLNSDDGCS